MPTDSNPKGPSLDGIIRHFQHYFEAGYVKTSTLRALDVKVEKLKMSSTLEFNVRRFRKKKVKSTSDDSGTVETVDSTFEINRPNKSEEILPIQNGSSILEIDIPEPSSSASSKSALEKEDDELERKLKSILDEAFFC